MKWLRNLFKCQKSLISEHTQKFRKFWMKKEWVEIKLPEFKRTEKKERGEEKKEEE